MVLTRVSSLSFYTVHGDIPCDIPSDIPCDVLLTIQGYPHMPCMGYHTRHPVKTWNILLDITQDIIWDIENDIVHDIPPKKKGHLM